MRIKNLLFCAIAFLSVGFTSCNEPIVVTDKWLIGTWEPYEWEVIYYDSYGNPSIPYIKPMEQLSIETIEFMSNSTYQWVDRSVGDIAGRYLVSDVDYGQKLTFYTVSEYHGEYAYAEWDISAASYKHLELSSYAALSIYNQAQRATICWKKIRK